MHIIPFQDLIRKYHSGESFVIFDTETTGLNTFHDDIVEIAGVIWQKGSEPKSFQELISVNTKKMSDGAWDIHKIPKEEIEKARKPVEVLADFITFCGNRSLVAHNMRFDYDILNSNLIRNGLKPYQNDHAACSLVYSKEQGKPGRLAELADFYNIFIKQGKLHRALYDVQILMQIMDRLMKEYEPEELQYSLIL